jgi:hypothetical protein
MMKIRIQAVVVALFAASVTQAQDCNSNGMSDMVEIQTRRGFDDNSDAILDKCQSQGSWQSLHPDSLEHLRPWIPGSRGGETI